MLSTYPINFEELEKGSNISAEEIEEAFGVRRTDPGYWKKQMRMRAKIVDEMAKRGDVVTVRSVGHGLRVLTDEEAAAYNPSSYMEGWRKMRRAHYRNMHVDVQQLPEEMRARHERTVEVQGKILQGAAKGRREARLSPSKRETPGLNG